MTDTNVLAARGHRAEDLFMALACTGRSNIFISAHVPGELDEHLVDVAANRRWQALAHAEQVLWGRIMVSVVDLAIGDCLHPRVRPMMCRGPDLPKRLRGDVDDLGAAALAEFLARSIIISADSVFTRLGWAETLADTCLPTAYKCCGPPGSRPPWLGRLYCWK